MTSLSSTFGSIKTTLLETKFTTPQSFKINVLPERVQIAEGIETFVEHYVLFPQNFTRVSKIVVHKSNIIKDVFEPMLNDCDCPLRETLARIGSASNADEAILYYDVMPSFGINTLKAEVEKSGKVFLGFAVHSLADVIAEFTERGVFGSEGAPSIVTGDVNSTNEVPEPSEIATVGGKHIRIERLDDIVEVHVPAKAMSLFFPALLNTDTILVKYLNHYLLSNHDLANKVPRGRVHSSCATGDVNRSFHCDCGFQLKEALKIMRDSNEGGFVVYHNAEGRALYSLHLKMCCYDITRTEKVDTYAAMVSLGYDADHRDYSAAATLLSHIGVEEIVLLSNNPEKRARLQAAGVRIKAHENIRLLTDEVPELTRSYLSVKQVEGGHDLGLPV